YLPGLPHRVLGHAHYDSRTLALRRCYHRICSVGDSVRRARPDRELRRRLPPVSPEHSDAASVHEAIEESTGGEVGRSCWLLVLDVGAWPPARTFPQGLKPPSKCASIHTPEGVC